jgi:hypothetical protein
VLLLSLAFVPVGCGPEYEVLTTPSDDGALGAGGISLGVGGGSGGTEEGGTTASGGVSTGGGISSGGTGISGTGMGAGAGIGGEGASGGETTSCMRHLDCPAQQTCQGGFCSPCADSVIDCSLPCPAQQLRVAIIRNGCAICECAPQSDCTSDAQCAPGEVCYQGAQCDDGCEGLDCCYGNHCGLPGCSGPPPSCTLSGCEGGGVCQPSCIESSCTCNGMTWLCSDTGMGTATGGSSGAGEGGFGAIGGNDCQGQCVPP